MLQVYPDYYKDFKCIADNCKHKCCIGWEIDIDEDTAALYREYDGILGERLRQNIDFTGDVPHFILLSDERCPFLNNKNLCDIITQAGEGYLCEICAQHPRFHNELPDRVESGLGLCCEEAARIILSKKDIVQLTYEGDSDCEDEIIDLRDKILATLQNRSLPLDERVRNILSLCNTSLPEKSTSQWADILLSLERLDESWTDLLLLLKAKGNSARIKDFDIYMRDRHTEYEQLLHYLIYRHLANAPDLEQAGNRAAFAVLCYNIIKAMGAVLWEKNKEFTLEEQIELCRMFSSEIEYSDENMYIILDELR